MLWFLLAEVALGLLLPTLGPTGAILVVVVVAAPVVMLVKAEHLVVLTMLSLYFSRLLVYYGAPSLLNYAHYPLAIVAMLQLLQTRGDVNRGLITALIVSLALTILSSAVGAWNAFRPILAWLTLYEPFIFFGLVVALDEPAKRHVRRLAIVIAFIQLPWAVSQFAAHSFGDPVQGTLVGQGAGHHIMGAICAAAGWLLLFSGKRTPLLVFGSLALLGVGVLSDAKQIYGALIVAVMLVGVLQARRVATSLLVPGIVLMALIYVSAQFYEPMEMIVDTKLGEELFGNKIEQASGIASDMGSGQSMLGLGAGNGLSRVALTSVPGFSTTVPAFIVGDDPSTLATAALAGYDEGEVSSAASPFSSWIGIYSDLGVLGLFAYVVAAAMAIRQLRRAGESHKRICYVLLGLAAVLGYVFTWLEEPSFTVFIALLMATGVPTAKPAVPADEDASLDASRALPAARWSRR